MGRLIRSFWNVMQLLAGDFHEIDYQTFCIIRDNHTFLFMEEDDNTVLLHICLYRSCEDFRWRTVMQRQAVLELANRLNGKGLPYTFFEEEGELSVRRRFTIPYGKSPELYVKEVYMQLATQVLPWMKKSVMADPCLAEGLVRDGYLGDYPPLKRIVKSCLWADVREYAEGLVAVADRQGYYGYLDADTQPVIPCRWTYADDFSEGLAAVADERGRYGFIDRQGRPAIPCVWHWAYRFSEGLAAVMDANGEWGFIDKDARLVVPCEWNEVEWFTDGHARVWDSEHRAYIIDQYGHII